MSSHYQRTLVEQLLPAVWDETYAYGMPNPYAPDDFMRGFKGTVDKKKGGTLFAHIADIKEAWRSTELTYDERRAVFMRYGLHDTQSAIARYEGVDQSTISRRLDSAVGKMTARLNDEEYVDGYDGLAELSDEAA